MASLPIPSLSSSPLTDELHRPEGRVGATRKPDPTLEAQLLFLRRFGFPQLFSDKDGYHVNVNLACAQEGATFKVASGFNHPTPGEAAALCISRTVESLRALGISIPEHEVP